MERFRFHSDSAVFFVTFSVVDWLPVFVSEPAFKIVTDSLNHCHANRGLRINAYVIMPTHFHAIVFDKFFRAEAVEQALTEFRKFTGRRLCDHCQKHMPACFTERFQSAAGDDRKRRFWQPTRHPVMIQSESFWETKANYLHENPCRKGLVTRAADWRYSSARYWLSEGREANDVVLSPLLV